MRFSRLDKILVSAVVVCGVALAGGCGHKDQTSAPGTPPPPDFAQQTQARMQAEQAQAGHAQSGATH